MARCLAISPYILLHLPISPHLSPSLPIYFRIYLPYLPGAWPALPPEIAARYRACFASRSVSPSILQRQVAAALAALGLGVREEVITPQGYSLDALVHVAGRDVGIEVEI